MNIEQKHLWLPYSQMQTAPDPFHVVSADGCTLTLKDGRELIDGITSWWSVVHGYQHPKLVLAITKQAKILSHVMLGGLVHEPALTLSGRLAAMLPADLNHVFFSDSGSTAVEVAMKMAMQYWRNVGKPNKNRLLCFSNSYHGDTLGAMSISDPEHSMHKAFKRAVIPQFVLDIPSDEYGFVEFETIISGIHKECAAMIIEPLVQGAGGMKFHSPDVLAALAGLAAKYEMLFIADEIATGFYRTGSRFAINEAGIVPDIMCLGKALTGGMLGLGATVARTPVFEAFLSDDAEKALMHGPTFMGNPLACAAANASLDLFEIEPRLAQAEAIETQLREQLEPCRALDAVKDVRIKGAIGVVELHAEFANPTAMRLAFSELGCWIRPFGNIVYLWPAFTISEAELQQLTRAIFVVLQKALPSNAVNHQPD